jgi:hypothetical protein
VIQQTEVLGVQVIYRDPDVSKWGLKNILLPIGGDILEVVSPCRLGTTAGRLLEKRGDGGYMIIMQNQDGPKRRRLIESRGLAKVIFQHETPGYNCTQYHPKGIKGGMMPELDSVDSSDDFPNPLGERFSPWGPCGPDFEGYSKGMKNAGDLHLVGALLRLAPGDVDTEGAAMQWSEIFGVDTSKDFLVFTNARMGFVKGEDGKPEGLDYVTVAVNGKERFEGILKRASKEGLCGDGWINMCGVRWYFVDADKMESRL